MQVRPRLIIQTLDFAVTQISIDLGKSSMALRSHWLRTSIFFGVFSLLSLVGFRGQPASAAGQPMAALQADACLVSLNNSGSTDYSSADASAVQSAVNAANSGDTLKVAGTCAGVATVSGEVQTVYINKNLTLQGGYTPTNWLASPDPVANPTVLDAQSAGGWFTSPAGVALLWIA